MSATRDRDTTNPLILPATVLQTVVGGFLECVATGYKLGRLWDHGVVRSALEAPGECIFRPIARALGQGSLSDPAR